MKVVFMGTPEFAVPSLKALHQSHEVVAVFTQPDRPAGRGKKLKPSPVKQEALAMGLTVYQPEKIKEAEWVRILKDLGADLFAVAAYGQILSQEILDIPAYGCVNVHASLLPAYRGAAPVQWAVIHGEKKTGITIMQMALGLDTGDMLLKDEIQIQPTHTGGSLLEELSHMGGPLLLKVLKQIESGTVIRIPQEEAESSYAPMIHRQTGRIKWEEEASAIVNLIRGLYPQPCAYTMYGEDVIKIWEAQVDESRKTGIFGSPGEILTADPKCGLYVACGQGVVQITGLQALGGKLLKTADFLRGRPMEPGKVFSVEG